MRKITSPFLLIASSKAGAEFDVEAVGSSWRILLPKGSKGSFNFEVRVGKKIISMR